MQIFFFQLNLCRSGFLTTVKAAYERQNCVIKPFILKNRQSKFKGTKTYM